jgi:hypothetical protein
MSRRQYSCGLAAAGAALPKNAAQAIAAAPEVKTIFIFSLQDLFAASRGRMKLGHHVPLSSLQIRHRVVDRPITCGYRNDAMRIDRLDTGGRFGGGLDASC